MKVLVGIDNAGVYRPALNLLSRLSFASAEVTLAHSVDVVTPMPMYGLAPEVAISVDISEKLRCLGEECLERAVEDACRLNVRAETAMLTGAPGPALIEFADRGNYELVVIHSLPKHGLGSLFLGSVARGLVIGSHRSILVSKGEPAPVGRLKAVFATDHSSYASAALELLLQMRPMGIEHVHVVSAAWRNEYEAFVAQYDLNKISGTTEEWVEARLAERNSAAVERLKTAGFDATCEVRAAAPDVALRESMERQGADLLIMGAQGHGFIHRLLIGSVSLHQIVAERYPVLVLRPKV